MIALASQTAAEDVPDSNARFLDMLPTIHKIASYAFRRLRSGLREELIAEVIANAFAAYHRLADSGRIDLAYPTVLAWFAVRQVHDDRRVGSRLNGHDVLSPYAQRQKGFQTHPLHRQNANGRWE